MANKDAAAPAPRLVDEAPPSVPAGRHPAVLSNIRAARALLPKLPLMLRVAVMHILNLSEQAPYLDLRSELIVATLRSFLEPSRPQRLSSTQRLTLADPGPRGRVWISRYTAPAPPETGIRDALLDAVTALRDALRPEPELRQPALVAVEAEWTGHRAGAAPGDPLPPLSEPQRYAEMMRTVTHPATVLYFHGGAYYMCDPASHRPLTRRLAKRTGGRCYSVRYRLAPQHPFPAALLDALVSYFALLYPPPGAYHDPVRPEHIVFSGDSAGANLAMALLRTILELRRRGQTVQWHGEPRAVPLPAAVACSSPWFDVTRSWPFWGGSAPAAFDYLPRAETQFRSGVARDGVWPATPPRRHIYVDDDLATHQLASLVMSDDWAGAPPIYMCTGWELLVPEQRFMAQKLATRCRLAVVYEEFEAMPHVFPMILPALPEARRCLGGWAAFIRRCVDEPHSVRSSAVAVRARTLDEVPLRFDELSQVTNEQAHQYVRSNWSTRGVPEALAKL